MRQRHREVVQLPLDAADLTEGFAEIHLGVPGRMRQGTNTSWVRRFFSRM
jgi:hypothetical protein